MKKIFIRSGMTPFEGLSPAQMLLDNSIGDNAGNLIYMNSIYRTLMTDDQTEFLPSRYEYYPSQARMINESCDSVVIPLADAFRSSFEGGLNSLTKLVKAVRVPCTVVGVGLRAPLGVTSFQDFPFNGKVKQFLSAVLDKSALVGVRGEITAEYLKTLGFLPEKHFTVIGCPSLYTWGNRLEVRPVQIQKNSRICVNNNVDADQNVQKFIRRLMAQYPGAVFLPQLQREFRTVYTGASFVHKDHSKDYPDRITDPVYREGRVRFFCDVPGWLAFLRESAFTAGPRMHGNIASILAGTPGVLIVKDSRMEELAAYHRLNCVYASEIGEDTTLEDLAEKADFTPMKKAAGENFRHYIHFRHSNGLKTIYDGGRIPAAGSTPFDRRMASVKSFGPILPVSLLSTEELADRWDSYYPAYEERYQKMLKETGRFRRGVERFVKADLLRRKILGEDIGTAAGTKKHS